MQPKDVEGKVKTFNIVFSPDAVSLPIYYGNAMTVAVGPSEFFITIGAVPPPEIRSPEDLQAFAKRDSLVAQPFVRMAVSPQAMEQFIALMRQQFEQFTLMRQQLEQFAGSTQAQDAQASEEAADDEGGNQDE